MAEILEYFKDINFMYNDCSMHETLAKMLVDFEAEIRASVIDEFAEKMKKMCKGVTILIKQIDEIAEQLKEET